MNPQHEYSIERWTHGWLLCAPKYKSGVPAEALELIPKLAGKNAIIDLAISHHLQTCGKREVCFTITSPQEAQKWRKEIEASLQTLDPQTAWWRGLHVGKSSASIFATFCRPELKTEAKNLGEGSLPQDADDLNRCKTLLTKFPDWKPHLSKVGETFPSQENRWKLLAQNWEKLESASPEEAKKLLQEINASPA